ncbi:MAG: class II glutamine amidotransferase [Rubrivivax sp.]|jgi:glutamine amidotransferase
MCQLLGMSCNTTASIHFSLTGFTRRGGHTADHVDGWGAAFFDEGRWRVFRDEAPAGHSPLARQLAEQPVPARVALAHLRKATQGEVSLLNCHPFQRRWRGQAWVFAGNGHLHDFHPALDEHHRPAGGTDTERAFGHLMQALAQHFGDEGGPLPWATLAPVVARLQGEVAQHGNFNTLLSNGEALFAHCSSRLHLLQRRHPFPTARLVDCDFSLDLGALNGEHDHMAVLATEPLTVDEPWQPLATGESRVLVDGQTVWRHLNPHTRCFPLPQLDQPVGRAWPPVAAAG